MTPLLVSTDWLANHLHDANLRIVDTRWYLLDKEKNGNAEYTRGHIPGAIFLDVDRDLASPPLHGPGRHPLPAPKAFAETASRAGIGPQTYVVAYDDAGGMNAARVWWLLRYFGHDGVSVLDGGITSWIAEGRPLDTAVPKVARAKFTARPHPDWVVDQVRVDALRQDPNALVLDARSAERYEGKVEPIDPIAGHIPGARSAPGAGNLRSPDDLRFREPNELRARFEDLGAAESKRMVCYCGSGINACQNILALGLAGFDDARLYEGSWSDWSRTPGRPVAVGPRP